MLAVAGACASAALGSSSRAAAAASRIVFAANRVPLWYGEIYRVDRDGRRVDLSNSSAPDLAPAVSPDGKQVAFVSTRGGHVALYVVGIDGRGLKRLSPLLFSVAPNGGPVAQIAWAPDSRSLATEISGPVEDPPHLFLADLSGHWRRIARDVDPAQAAPTWSPDGRLLAYTTNYGLIKVVRATGKNVWAVAGLGAAAWSADDRLAVATGSEMIHVYDVRGRVVAGFRGQTFAWSPGGKLLASKYDRRLQVRRGGSGTPILDVRLATALRGSSSIQWVGPSRVRLFGSDGWTGFDVTHKRTWKLSGAATLYSSVVAGNEVAAEQLGRDGSGATLSLSRLDASGVQTLQTAPFCGDQWSFENLAFIPHGSGLVYQSGCGDPSANIYSVSPDGSGLVQITETPTDERQPSLSPDGSSVVYVQQQFAEGCKGCPQTLWRVPSAGGTPQQLTAHTYQDDTPFDTDPSWSPDGQQIAFLRGGVDGPSTLFTIPASGGPAQSLTVKGSQPKWGPQQIAYLAPIAKATVKTLDPTTGATRTVATDGTNAVGPFAWSPDGRLAYLLFSYTGKPTIMTIGSNSKPTPLSPILPPNSQVTGLAWSPDGKQFALTATDANGIGEVYTIGIDGKNLTQVTNSIGAIGCLSWR
jgi:Tol biopolymer transport system component